MRTALLPNVVVHERHHHTRGSACRARLCPRRRILHRQQRARRLPVRGRPVPPLRTGLSAARASRGPGCHGPAPGAHRPSVGTPGPARGRRDGRLQPGRHRRGTQRGTGRAGGSRGLRARGRGRRRPAARGPPSATGGAVRGLARRPRGPHRPGVGVYGRGGNRVLGVRPRGRGRVRRPRRAGTAPLGPAAAVRHGVRRGRRRVGARRTARRRRRVAAHAGHHRDPRAAVAGGDRHGDRLRVLVHGHAADRRRARHAVLRSHPGRRGLHRAAGRHRLLRPGAGRGQRPGRRRSRPGFRRVGPASLSGCRRAARARRAPGRRSSGRDRSPAAGSAGPWG